MVVVVSQSGYSLNALDAVRVIRAKGRRCIGLTGDLESDLAKACDVVANYGVGRETVAYVTRGVTTLALFFMLFAVKEQLLRAAEVNAQVQAQLPPFIEDNYRALSGAPNVFFVPASLPEEIAPPCCCCSSGSAAGSSARSSAASRCSCAR